MELDLVGVLDVNYTLYITKRTQMGTQIDLTVGEPKRWRD